MKAPPVFVHLRVHSAYSLSEGALPIKQLAELARAAKMPALAITDTGNLFGALEFCDYLAEKSIQPIVGCSLKINFPELADCKTLPSLVFLAKNAVGYGNLMKLSSHAYLDVAAEVEPHCSWAFLEKHHEGLIVLSGGPSGPINQALIGRDLAVQKSLALTLVEKLQTLFGDRFYLELQRHGLPQEQIIEPELLNIACEKHIALVATNEPFFATPDDYVAQDVLLCIADGVVSAAEDRRRLTKEHYFKNQQEMATLFADIPEAIENTLEISKRCAFLVKGSKPILPRFGCGDEAEELRGQAQEGLAARLQATGPAPGFSHQDYHDRLEFELSVIIKMNYAGYFLIVADFIKHAKSKDIPVGPGRGSGAGSLVAYVLTITDLDPLRFGLIFERFLNPERVSMPDFDIDFCQDRRDEVIDYVQARYGKDHVAQIITFGKLQARAVVRDVGRVLQVPYRQVDRISKMIPNNPAKPLTLQEAIAGEARLREERDNDSLVAMMLQIGMKLEGLYRHAATHAAGIVIGDRPLEELVPLYRDPRSSLPATQYNMKYAEKAGLVKFDFLGLKTLTVIDKAQTFVRRRQSDFNISSIALDDKATFAMLARGDTVGVFQLESLGMRDAVRQMRADRFEDLIALVALYRPGPMANIPLYCARKLGREPIEYLHPSLEPILAETFGVITYQEQVQQIAKSLAGYSLAEADLLRRAMGKKIQAEMDSQRERFIDGAVTRGLNGEVARLIFEACAKFAEYGFNKSHSAPYAYISYQTAYLKANYPVEFLAASMSLERANTDKLQIFREEAKRLGIDIIPPCVNYGEVDFRVHDGKIVYSLAALKNVGAGGVAGLMMARQKGGAFKSLSDFICRVPSAHLNKRALESLAKAGAFDSLEPNRAMVLAGVETLLNRANAVSEAASTGQISLFGLSEGQADDLALPFQENWLALEKLAAELEAVGFYLSGHPLDEDQAMLSKLGVEPWSIFRDKARTYGARAARLAATVAYRREKQAKSGNKFAFVSFSDPSGQFEAICFSDVLVRSRDLLEPGKAVILRVEADIEEDDVKLRIQAVEPLEKALAHIISGISIYVRDAKPVAAIAQCLQAGGKAPARLTLLQPEGAEIEIQLGEQFQINPQVKSAIRAISGVIEIRDL